MDILKPEMIAMVIGVVGTCEAAKRCGLRVHTAFVSLAVSILCGIAAASPLTWQTGIVSAVTVYGAATLAYETVLKRFKHDNK